MTEKLVKTGNDYILYSKDKTVLGITSGTMEGRMLSLKNCQAIENGYDLDEVVEDIVKTIVPNDRGEDIWYGTSMAVGKLCFQKALEILGDKKFSENEMWNMFYFGDSLKNQIKSGKIENKPMGEIFDNYIQSLQQTEWDVEIVMDICGDTVYAVPEPALDENGCLILRRI